jgi:Secretion system C-terminal sorting domain
MKNLVKIYLAVFLLLILQNSAFAQFTITASNCSSGNSNVITPGPGSTGAYYPVGTGGSCSVTNLTGPLPNLYTLYKLVSGSWVAQTGTGSVVAFTGLAPGTYQVTGQFSQIVSSACPDGYIKIYDYSGRLIGYGGNYGALQTSNILTIGPPSSADVTFSFIHDAEWGAPNYPALGYYDPSGIVKISTTGTRYSSVISYKYAVTETDGSGNVVNYWLRDWISGQMPTTPIDLSNLCSRGQGYPANWTPYHGYSVLLAIDDDPCGTGTYEQYSQSFTVCTSGAGCELTELSNPISIAPNPATGSFRLTNVLFNPGAEYRLTLMDLSGRLVKEYANVSQQGQDYDISELSTGLFVANLWNGSERIFSSKLSVSK